MKVRGRFNPCAPVLLGALCALGACSLPPGPIAPDPPPSATIERRLRRLSAREYNNVVRDLLGDETRPADEFIPEEHQNGFDNGSAGLVVEGDQAVDYQYAAEALAERAVADLPRLLRGCDPVADGVSACWQRFLAWFPPRAYRRPLTGTELGRLQGIYETGVAGRWFRAWPATRHRDRAAVAAVPLPRGAGARARPTIHTADAADAAHATARHRPAHAQRDRDRAGVPGSPARCPMKRCWQPSPTTASRARTTTGARRPACSRRRPRAKRRASSCISGSGRTGWRRSPRIRTTTPPSTGTSRHRCRASSTATSSRWSGTAPARCASCSRRPARTPIPRWPRSTA